MVTESSEESGSIRRPGQAQALRKASTFTLLGAKSVNDNLGFKIPNLDRVISGSTEPVAIGREAKSVDDFTRIQRVETLSLVQVPKHGSVVLSSTGSQRTIRRNTDSVQVSSVSHKVVAKLAVGQIPDLDKTIPATRDNKGNGLGRGESDARNPFGVAFRVAANGVFTFTKRVPKTDCRVARSRNNLPVVHRESNRKNILFVAYKAASGFSY